MKKIPIKNEYSYEDLLTFCRPFNDYFPDRDCMTSKIGGFHYGVFRYLGTIVGYPDAIGLFLSPSGFVVNMGVPLANKANAETNDCVFLKFSLPKYETHYSGLFSRGQLELINFQRTYNYRGLVGLETITNIGKYKGD